MAFKFLIHRVSNQNSNQLNYSRWLEMAGIFLGIPLFHSRMSVPHVKIASLLAVCSVCHVLILRDKTFYRNRFGFNGFRAWYMLAIRFAVIVGCFSLYTIVVDPESPRALFQHNYMSWALLMILYPVFSVIPQEIIYRAFFFHRYGSLFKEKRVSWLVNTMLFAFGHILFKNWVAIIGSFVFSLIWATTYLQSRSILTVTIEHALYGDSAFILGVGYYFYSPDF